MLSDDEIAVLCDIGQASTFDADKKARVLSLVTRGYIERDGDQFKLTPHAQKVLSSRGAGLNES